VAAVGLRERKKERTRDALAEAALQLSAARGFDHVTVEAIADACDVSPRTFFRYFASKEDALFADTDRLVEQLLASLTAAPAERSALDALEAAMRDLAGTYAVGRERVLARHAVIAATPSLRTRIAERQRGWEAAVMEHLRGSGRADGMSDLDVRLLVATANAALRVAIESWLEAGASGDVLVLVDGAFRRLRTGLAPG
jgi:AcrR family transcriptional regulator